MSTPTTSPPTAAPGPASPDAVPTPDEFVARAAALRDLLVEHQPDAEARTTFSPEMDEVFLRNGFYRALVPKRFGGYELDVKTVFRSQLELARGDVSTAWCMSLSANHALQVGSWFGEQAQAEAFADVDFRAASVSAPSVKAERVEDGWSLKGGVSYCSGIPYSTYYMGQALVDGYEPGDMALYLAPRGTYEVLDDWGRTLGLRGSGSNSIRFDGAVIPEHLVLEHTNMIGVDPWGEGTPGWRLHGNPMYGGRSLSLFTLSLCALVIGGGYNLLDDYEAQLRTKSTPLPPFISRQDDADFQRWYGSAFIKLQMAERTMLACLDEHAELCALNAAGERPFTWADDNRLAAIGREAFVGVWEAVERDLYRTAGSSAARQGERFERVFRDLAMAAGHRNTMLREPTYRMVARQRLGLEA